MDEINIIWDVDGTLIDSYDSIIKHIKKTINHFNIDYSSEFIRDMCQKESTTYFYEYVSKNNNISFEEIFNYHNSDPIRDLSLIKLMPSVKEFLETSKELNVKHYIYTHRGITTNKICEMLGVKEYFEEIVTSENGFKRKPDPEAINYLIDKYQMNKENTYYLGDRLLDQRCGRNAGIKAIYYQSYKGIELDKREYDIKINDLKELIDIFK